MTKLKRNGLIKWANNLIKYILCQMNKKIMSIEKSYCKLRMGILRFTFYCPMVIKVLNINSKIPILLWETIEQANFNFKRI